MFRFIVWPRDQWEVCVKFIISPPSTFIPIDAHQTKRISAVTHSGVYPPASLRTAWPASPSPTAPSVGRPRRYKTGRERRHEQEGFDGKTPGLRSPLDSSQNEFHQQDGALSWVDGVRGRQPLAELVEQGGHQVFQPGHGDAGVEVDGVQPGVSHRLDHVVYVDQMHWKDRTMPEVRLVSTMRRKREIRMTYGCTSSG